MYGGGFATVPAYLKDLFGTIEVGAIHGRLLTAWSAAGVAGPVLVNYIRQFQIDHGTPKAEAYTVTMYIMAGLLILGFLCSSLASARVNASHHAGESLAGCTRPRHSPSSMQKPGAKKRNAPCQIPHLIQPITTPPPFSPAGTAIRLAFAWLWVGILLLIGVTLTIQSSLPLFQPASKSATTTNSAPGAPSH